MISILSICLFFISYIRNFNSLPLLQNSNYIPHSTKAKVTEPSTMSRPTQKPVCILRRHKKRHRKKRSFWASRHKICCSFLCSSCLICISSGYTNILLCFYPFHYHLFFVFIIDLFLILFTPLLEVVWRSYLFSYAVFN